MNQNVLFKMSATNISQLSINSYFNTNMSTSETVKYLKIIIEESDELP